MSKPSYLSIISIFSLFLLIFFVSSAFSENLVLSANGGKLEEYTSAYSDQNDGHWYAEDLTNGITFEDGWASTESPGPQSFIYSFKDGCNARVVDAVIHSGLGEFGRYLSENVEIWTSTDGIDYTLAASGTLPNTMLSSITLSLGNTEVKTVKLVITSGYSSEYWELGEFVVNGDLVDTIPPVITLLGSNPMNLSVGDTYVEPGATVTDNMDVDVSVNVSGTVNMNEVGSYTISYNATDEAGNAAAEVTRTVTVRDTTPPVITLIGANTINLALGDTYVEPGATATDNVDGDVSVNISGTVNTNEVGSYTISYNAIDEAGNATTEVTRTVNVRDVTPPVITLIGADTISLTQDTVYTEPGATATDNVDGDVSVIISGTVSSGVVGIYTIRYNAADEAGNAAAEVTRTVTVRDTRPPVITLVGANPMTLTRGITYAEPGATATDNVDGYVGVNISGTVNTNEVGIYTISYNAIDEAGNAAAEVTRTVNVVPDTTPPVITLTGANTMTLTLGDTYVEPGATATDNVDGDVSVNISGTVNTNEVGIYIIRYNAADESGNAAAEVTRTVTVRDITPPVITLTGPNPLTLTQDESYVEPGVTATDNVDGNISVNISGTVNSGVVGIYTIRYNAADEAGNAAAEVTRTVIVRDTTPPVITLLGVNPMTLTLDATYSEPGAIATDNVDGYVSVNISGTVNTNVVGIYTIRYNATDEAGNAAVEVLRTVTVRDITPPVITLAGANPMTLTLGDTYAEPGATATDNVDGYVSVNISGTVNTGVVGGYTIRYNATDEAGNAAAEVTRIVNVRDVTPPVITLTGANTMTLTQDDTYAELGATATDNVDGDVSVNISGTVNSGVVGIYIIRYNATDEAGNAAAEVTRTVTVRDTTPPVITLIGSNTMTLTIGATYAEPGAIATDNVNGDVSVNISGTVNTGVVGIYTISYNATDEAGNAAAEVRRTVTVRDVTPPVITLAGAGAIDLTLGDTYVEQGATATDNVDGNVSVNISGTVNTNEVGIYTISYNATDEAGNAAAEVTRTVIVRDVTPPVIRLTGANTMTLTQDDTYSEPGATATDNVDGNISVNISGTVNSGVVGIYTISYNATDEAGNAATEVTRTVNILDTTPPVINLIGSNTMTLTQDDTYSESGATATDNVDGDVSVNISGTVNTGVVGIYTISYNAADEAGNAATEVTRTVTVRDTTPPVITLLGANPMTLTQGDTYAEPGATATDNVDGDISVEISGTVNTNEVGSYIISYNVSDEAGNISAVVTRTVVVNEIKYSLTVTNGNGGGHYTTDEYTTITANAAPEGQVFDVWVVNSGSLTIENENVSSTTVVMLENDATVMASYKDLPDPENLLLPANGGVMESFTSGLSNDDYAVADLTDGEVNDGGWSGNFNPGNQEFIYSFSEGQIATLNEVVIYSGYFSGDVEVWTSFDGNKYTKAAEDTLNALGETAITLNLGNIIAKTVKLVIKNINWTGYWEIDEFEVYGVLETAQPHVDSFLAYDSQRHITIETPAGTTLWGAEATALPEPVPAEAELSYGFFDFTIENIGAGGSTTATIHLPDDAEPTSYYIFGKTPDDETEHWYEFLYDETTGTGAEFDGNIITLHFVDGLRGDNDLDGTNGIIVAPGAPGVNKLETPQAPDEEEHDINTSENADEESGDSGWSDARGCFIESLFSA